MKQKLSIILFLITYLPAIVGMVIGNAEKVFGADEATDEQTITVEKRLGDNMVVTDVLSPVRVVCELSSPVHNMWSGRFHHIKTDQPTMIGWNMEGQNGGTNVGNVTKWVNLKPVVCEGDDTLWDAYQFWTKNANDVWECTSDPFRTGPDRFAGNGKVPIQSAIPTEIADAYLDPTRKYFQCWREVDSEVIPTLNTYRAICHFNAESATLAMRMPFRYSYLESFVDKLGNANMSGVFVDAIGTTAQGRKLQVIRLEDVTNTAKPEEQKTVLMVSAEHASEVSSVWTNYGALVYLLQGIPEAKRLRKDTTWLFLLLEDPDGTDNVTFDNLTERFRKPNDPDTPSEVFAYVRYLTDYVNHGRTIDIALSLHNVEVNECCNVFSPFIDYQYKRTQIDFNQAFFSELKKRNYQVNQPDQYWGQGSITNRLYGWCSLHFGSIALAYEVNDRYPEYRLSALQTREVGMILASSIHAWLLGDEGKRWHQKSLAMLAHRAYERQAYFARRGYSDEKRTKYDMLTCGY